MLFEFLIFLKLYTLNMLGNKFEIFISMKGDNRNILDLIKLTGQLILIVHFLGY